MFSRNYINSFRNEGTFILDIDHETKTVEVAYNLYLEDGETPQDWYAAVGADFEEGLRETFGYSDREELEGDEQIAYDENYKFHIVRVFGDTV